jgi:glycosyltransferase involved in cell wall biosynthesis
MQRPVKKLEVLISALGISSEELLPHVAKQVLAQGSHGLVINQTKDRIHFASASENLRIFHFNELGISKSRNRALSKATGDFLLFTDEDVALLDGFSRTITGAFEKNPQADIITFQCLNQEGQLRKKYSDRPFWHNARTLMRVSSVEIAIRRESLVQNPLLFDERFGIGSQIPTGSESVFLSDALTRGLKILYQPVPIVRHPDASSGRALYHNRDLLKAKGALFYRIFGQKAYLLSLYFALKKTRETGFSLLQGMQMMLSGIREFKALDHGR